MVRPQGGSETPLNDFLKSELGSTKLQQLDRSKFRGSLGHLKDEGSTEGSMKMKGVRFMQKADKKHTVLGLSGFLKVDKKEVNEKCLEGLDAIREEFMKFQEQCAQMHAEFPPETFPGWYQKKVAKDALECMIYVLDEEAGSMDKIWPNWKYPMDCGRNPDDDKGSSLLPERQIERKGMRLADFCDPQKVPEIKTAQLEETQYAAFHIHNALSLLSFYQSPALPRLLRTVLFDPWQCGSTSSVYDGRFQSPHISYA